MTNKIMMVCTMYLVTCVFYMSLCTLTPIILVVWVAQRRMGSRKMNMRKKNQCWVVSKWWAHINKGMHMDRGCPNCQTLIQKIMNNTLLKQVSFLLYTCDAFKFFYKSYKMHWWGGHLIVWTCVRHLHI
jgi:hypothetical protein